MSGDPNQLYLIGCSHHSAPLELRERLALNDATHRALYEGLRAAGDLRESFVLHTCNRLEVYAVGNGTTPRLVREVLGQVTGGELEAFSVHGYERHNLEAVQHLYEVAAGLNSQLIGETEIFGQLKHAYEEACERQTVGHLLHRVIQKSFQAGKWARTHTAIGRGQVSLGNIAVELAERVFGSLRRARALVVGSGQVSCDVAKALRSRGLGELTVSSRRLERAAAVAKEVGGVPLPFERWPRVLEHTDVAIFATSAPEILLTAAEVQAVMSIRKGEPLFLIDLAVPRDVDAAAGELESVFLYNLEDLSEIANTNLRLRQSEVEKCRHALRERASSFWSRVGG
jgi:glutamyl-tRNA reductase